MCENKKNIIEQEDQEEKREKQTAGCWYKITSSL